MTTDEKLAIIALAILEIEEKAVRTWDNDGEDAYGAGLHLSEVLTRGLRDMICGSIEAGDECGARLIAAAPDLLEACRLAVGPLGSTGPTPVYEAVLAAILKATTPNAGERG